jgi:hypothetical protein
MATFLRNGRSNWGPLIEVSKYVWTVERNPWNSTDALSLLLSPSLIDFHKSFTFTNLHGEGIEPPTYWV